ncbi:MAG: 3-hydroxyanthranilate 3,4-dioxygenase [Pseudomonadota bacterium]
MQTLKPFNFQRWIDEHRHLLRPPVCNKQVFEDTDFIVMVVGGPNARRDFHYDEGEELFYQLEGDMTLHTIRDGEREAISIRAGEMLLLPPRVPHSPQRYADTVGLVVERKRRPDEKDGFQWYCDECNALLYEEYLHIANIETDLPPVLARYDKLIAGTPCPKCQTPAPANDD